MHKRELSECKVCNSNKEHELRCTVEDLNKALDEALRMIRHACHGSLKRCGRCDMDEQRLRGMTGDRD